MSKLRTKRKLPTTSNEPHPKRVRIEFSFESLFKDKELKALIEQFQTNSKLEIRKLVGLGYKESEAIEKILNDLFPINNNTPAKEHEIMKYGFTYTEAQKISKIKEEIIRLRKSGNDTKRIIEELLDRLKKKNRKIKKPYYSHYNRNNNNNSNTRTISHPNFDNNNNNNEIEGESDINPFKKQKMSAEEEEDQFTNYWEPFFNTHLNNFGDNNNNNSNNNNKNDNKDKINNNIHENESNNDNMNNNSNNNYDSGPDFIDDGSGPEFIDDYDSTSDYEKDGNDNNMMNNNSDISFGRNRTSSLQSRVVNFSSPSFIDDMERDGEDDEEDEERNADYFDFEDELEDEEIESPPDSSVPFFFDNEDEDSDNDVFNSH